MDGAIQPVGGGSGFGTSDALAISSQLGADSGSRMSGDLILVNPAIPDVPQDTSVDSTSVIARWTGTDPELVRTQTQFVSADTKPVALGSYFERGETAATRRGKAAQPAWIADATPVRASIQSKSASLDDALHAARELTVEDRGVHAVIQVHDGAEAFVTGPLKGDAFALRSLTAPVSASANGATLALDRRVRMLVGPEGAVANSGWLPFVASPESQITSVGEAYYLDGKALTPLEDVGTRWTGDESIAAWMRMGASSGTFGYGRDRLPMIGTYVEHGEGSAKPPPISGDYAKWIAKPTPMTFGRTSNAFIGDYSMRTSVPTRYPGLTDALDAAKRAVIGSSDVRAVLQVESGGVAYVTEPLAVETSGTGTWLTQGTTSLASLKQPMLDRASSATLTLDRRAAALVSSGGVRVNPGFEYGIRSATSQLADVATEAIELVRA